jgi:hypothetical protein
MGSTFLRGLDSLLPIKPFRREQSRDFGLGHTGVLHKGLHQQII